MARSEKAEKGTSRRSSARTTARRSTNGHPQTVASLSRGAPENGAPKPSDASAPTSRLGVTDDESLIDDVTQQELAQGITGYAIIDYRQAPRKD
jgi:hypothetical protein